MTWAQEETSIQLDWPSETDTLKINLPRDREGYDGFEYTDEQLLTRVIHLRRAELNLLGTFEEQLPK